MNKTGIMNLVVINIIAGSATASNMCDTYSNAIDYNEMYAELDHNTGNDSYPEESFFPIGWDLRHAYDSMRSYSEQFIFYPQGHYSYSETAFENLIDDMTACGMNYVMIRSGISGEMGISAIDEIYYQGGVIEDSGLHYMIGGYKSGSEYISHNQGVLAFIEEVIADWEDASIIGAGAMNCPDSYHLLDPGDGHLESVIAASQNLELLSPSVPFFSFLEGYGDYQQGWNTSNIDLFAQYIPLPSYDYYPIRPGFVMAGWGNQYLAHEWTSADLWPEINGSSYFKAYTTRDELIGLTRSGQLEMSIYQIDDDPENFGMHLVDIHGGTPLVVQGAQPIDPTNYEFCTSGPTSADLGDRSAGAGENNLNGGVAFWTPGATSDYACFVKHHNGVVNCIPIPSSGANDIVNMMVVGQDDYYSDNLPPYPVGLLCQDETRLLVSVSSPNRPTEFIQIWSCASGTLQLVQDNIIVPFQPSGGLWGSFWPSDGNEWNRIYRSAFVLYDENGKYFVLHRADSSAESWIVTEPESGNEYLFGELAANEEIVDIDLFRPALFNYLSCSYVSDCIVGLIVEMTNGTPRRLSVRHGRNSLAWEFAPDESLNEVSFLRVPLSMNDCSNFVISTNGETKHDLFIEAAEGVYRQYGIVERIWDPLEVQTLDPSFTLHPYAGLADNPLRIRPSRRCNTRTLVLVESTGRDMYQPQIYKAKHNQDDLGDYLSYFYESIDIQHEYAVSNQIPGRYNCLMTTIQAFGRSSSGTAHCSPSLDSLLYLCTSSIVHGTRGLIFYNLGHALEASYGNEGTQDRLPWIMTSWNGSIDPENPGMDLVETVHTATAILTGTEYNGWNTGIDWLSTLASDDWEVIQADPFPGLALNEEPNGLASTHADLYQTAPPYAKVSDDYRNFLALRNLSTNELVIYVVNDGEDYVTDVCIGFPSILMSNHTVSTINGYWPDNTPEPLIENSCQTDYAAAYYRIDLSQLPPFSAALLHATVTPIAQDMQHGHSALIDCQQASLSLLSSVSDCVKIDVTVSSGRIPFSVSLVDLMGRTVACEHGNASCTVSFSTADLPTGLYAVVFESGGRITTEKVVLTD